MVHPQVARGPLSCGGGRSQYLGPWRGKGGAMQAAVRLKGVMMTVSASPKSPVEVSAAAVDASRIGTSRRMLAILWQFSRLAAAAALKFSTIAFTAFELLAPSCLSRTSGIERSPAPCCSSQCCAVLACLLLQRGRFCFGTSRRCAPRDAERAARELRRRPASRERQHAPGLHAAQHAWPSTRRIYNSTCIHS